MAGNATAMPTFAEVQAARRKWESSGRTVRRRAADVYELNPDDPAGEPVWRVGDDEELLSTREFIARAAEVKIENSRLKIEDLRAAAARRAAGNNGRDVAGKAADARPARVKTLAEVFGLETSAPASSAAAADAPRADVRRLAIGEIRRDGGTQPRAALDDETLAEYAEAMKAGAEFPPVIVFYDGAAYWLADGFHRVNAAMRAELTTVAAQVMAGTQRDAILYSTGANAAHGLRRTNADKRRAVERLLRDDEWAKWSDSEIARRCAVDHKTVAAARLSLGNSQVTSDERIYTTRHGTVATMNTAAIGQASQSEHIGRAPAQGMDENEQQWTGAEPVALRPADVVEVSLLLGEIAEEADIFFMDRQWLADYAADRGKRKGLLVTRDQVIEELDERLREAQAKPARIAFVEAAVDGDGREWTDTDARGQGRAQGSARPAAAVSMAWPAGMESAQVGPVNIFRADARELATVIGAQPVDLVITSPPYNVGMTYDGHDDGMSEADYYALLVRVFKQCGEVMTPGGRLCVNVPFGVGRNPWAPVTPTIYQVLAGLGFEILGQIIWDKGMAGNSTAWGSWRRPDAPSLRDTCEAVIVARKPGDLEAPAAALVRGEGGRLESPWLDGDTFMTLTQDHWVVAPESATAIGHPAPFPVKLVSNLVRLYAWPGAHVLDPFAGSGTTGVAVVGLAGGDRCRVSLVEQSAEYCGLARRRIERAVAAAGQGRLGIEDRRPETGD